MKEAEKRAVMPKGSSSVLDRRTVVNGNANLLKLVRRGDHVLDVGCGSGAITKDIAGLVGSTGYVRGIDSSDHLIIQARENFPHFTNLEFEMADINTYPVDKKFDVVTSARVLQWLSNPMEVLEKLKDLVKDGGCLTILDYNHEKVEFSPGIPASMKKVYDAFLRWREQSGMDNRIADHLKDMFQSLQLKEITVDDYSEASISGKDSFEDEISLWVKVADARGPQLVSDNYITETERLSAIADYTQWMKTEAKYMRLYLKAVTGYR